MSLYGFCMQIGVYEVISICMVGRLPNNNVRAIYAIKRDISAALVVVCHFVYAPILFIL